MFERAILIALIAVTISAIAPNAISKVRNIGDRITTVAHRTIVSTDDRDLNANRSCTPKIGSETGCYAPTK